MRAVRYHLNCTPRGWELQDLDGRVFIAPFASQAEACDYLVELARQGFDYQDGRAQPAQEPAGVTTRQATLL